MNAWRGFKEGNWKDNIDVTEFIRLNYTEYLGDDSFLEGPTEATTELWKSLSEKFKVEREKGIYDAETKIPSQIDAYGPGYINKDLEKIVGLQTDAPLKRAIFPNGGLRMVKNSLESFGYKLDPQTEEIFSKYRKTHNDGVFSAYTDSIKKARHTGIITGLPDAYGRGRIIGDYRRVALYGIDRLREDKLNEFRKLESELASEDIIRLREELSEQYRALDEMKKMALEYGYDISVPATNAKEAIQWLYFAYLAAVKENNGAAMSLGRNGAFLDIYIKRDIDEGTLTESEAQELIDQFVMKLRMMRHLRTPEYDDLFAGDPTWVTESLGGMGLDGRTLVTKTAFRILHTLTNLDSSPEPNMTVLWSLDLPEAWKNYCSKMSIQTGSLQYENDDAMRPVHGDDYAIACCVSSMVIGKQMQFFGARANLAKSLLYAINGGVDEMKRAKDGSLIKVLDGIEPIKDEVLDFDKVYTNYKLVLEKVAKLYVNTMNTIHYMHDKYAYEAGQMALHDTFVHRYMAFGVAGISIVADSLSAIKYAKVKPIRDENGLAIDFEVEGDFPTYGNDDDRVDSIGVEVIEGFMEELRKTPTYRNSEHTLSILTITSNVVYGKKTGTTPDGRKKGEPFAPGANPMHGRDKTGAIASLNSVAKIPFAGCCQDGISNTFSIVPTALGKSEDERKVNLTNLMDGYFEQLAFHLNVNVLDRATLLDAYDHPEKYPNLTIRVSGYAVRFNRLTKEQQMEVIHRTFHESR